MPITFTMTFRLRDEDGTELIDLAAARDHAAGVARELTFKSANLMAGGLVELDNESPRSRGHRIIFLGHVRL